MTHAEPAAIEYHAVNDAADLLRSPRVSCDTFEVAQGIEEQSQRRTLGQTFAQYVSRRAPGKVRVAMIVVRVIVHIRWWHYPLALLLPASWWVKTISKLEIIEG